MCVYLKVISEPTQYLSPVSESYDTDVYCYQPWPVIDIIGIFCIGLLVYYYDFMTFLDF